MSPRLVVSVNDLIDLNEGTLLLDTDGVTWRKEFTLWQGDYWSATDACPTTSGRLADGRPLLVLYDPNKAALIDSLREHLASRLEHLDWGTMPDLILFDFLSCWDKRHLSTTD